MSWPSTYALAPPSAETSLVSMMVEITRTATPFASAKTVLRKQFVLAFIISLHLMALAIWLQEKRLRVVQQPTLISILLLPTAKDAAPIVDRPSPSSYRTPTANSKKKFPVHDISPLDASPSRAGTNQSDAASDAAASTPASPPEANFNMDLFRRAASRVARAIAQEQPSVPAGPDSSWTRFRNNVDAAHLEAGVWQDSYTAPDGTIIYRKHIGGRTICRMSGNVGPENGVIKGIDEAGSIACPSHGQWNREP